MEKTITFFPDFFESIEFLPDELFGAAMRAAMKYQMTGEEYAGDNPAVKMAFNFAKGQTDRKREYSKTKSESAKSRWAKSDDAQCERMQNDATGINQMQVDANRSKAMQSDAPCPNPNPNPNPNHEESVTPANARKPIRKSYGQYGWVKLSDAEFDSLVNDLGLDEAERCIAYIDECAQGTGNKNKWRDWNLVVRKCHRDGWGRHLQGGYKRKERPGDIHGCGELGRAELEAIAMTLRQPLTDFVDGIAV